jgi:hypothetical protein
MNRRRRGALYAMVGLAALGAGLGTIAIISGSSLAGGDDGRHLDVSSIDLTVGTGEASLRARNMVPGDIVTSVVTVVNSGGQPMTYSMTHGLVSADGFPLANALILTIKTVGSSCTAFDGVTLFEGPVSEAAFGHDDTGRPLAAATADILCLRSSLPIDGENELQGAASTIALVFEATRQTAVR